MSTADDMPPVSITAIRWKAGADGGLELLDQTRLPHATEWVSCGDVETVVEAIRSLRVRGAPAIGIAGAYGLAVAADEAVRGGLAADAARAHVLARAEELATARPTAVNLRWAVERCVSVVDHLPADTSARDLSATILTEARAIHEEDRKLCESIGRHGAAVIPDGDVLTHCNTGALATGGEGTAIAVIVELWRRGRRFTVYADETRPLFQGSRLTAWELLERGIPVTVLVDAAAAHLMHARRIACVIVGADRITRTGDTANKIGTYGLAVLAAAHGIPFYVAAPSSTFDLTIESGDEIPIEERAASEVTDPAGVPTAAPGAAAFNPAFDVTPARLIGGIITEKGVIEPVTSERVAAMLSERGRLSDRGGHV